MNAYSAKVRTDVRVQRAEVALLNYLDGDLDRLFTEEATKLFAQLCAARLRVVLELEKEEQA